MDVYYVSIKIFITLPASTTELANDRKRLITALKRFLVVESSYSINEY